MDLQEERENWNNLIELTKALRIQGHRNISYRRFTKDQILGIVLEELSWNVFDGIRIQRSFDRMKVDGTLIFIIESKSRESYFINVNIWVAYD